jgi:cardiolipin synthase (CMP-forming)
MISNTITIFRTLLTIPLFALLAFGGNAWAALALFLSAGALDMVDGKVARARNETSAFGAMIDLLGDRLLTLAVVLGLVIGSEYAPGTALFGLVLVVRDVVVATLNEAVPGKLEIRVSVLEKVKIACAFVGLSALIVAEALYDGGAGGALTADAAPQLAWRPLIGTVGAVALFLAALLTLVTLADYWRRALREFAKG